MTPTDASDEGVAPVFAIAVLLGVTLVAAAGTVGFLWTITPAEKPRPPTTNFDAEQDTITLTVDGERVEVTRVTFRHEGGDTADPGELTIRVNAGYPNSYGLDAAGRVTAFEGDAVQHGDAVSVVAVGSTDGAETASVDFTVESVDGERRLTDGNGIVVELQPGDEVRLVWSDGEYASTLLVVEVS